MLYKNHSQSMDCLPVTWYLLCYFP